MSERGRWKGVRVLQNAVFCILRVVLPDLELVLGFERRNNTSADGIWTSQLFQRRSGDSK